MERRRPWRTVSGDRGGPACVGGPTAPGRAGFTLSLPDALIGATALLASIPFYTCNPRHYPMPDLDLCAVSS